MNRVTKRSAKLENYEHVLMCLICRSLFDDHDHQPKFLPCHHTFCKECLREYVRQMGDEIECPSCRKVATVPAAGVAALQTNFYAKYIQSLVYGCGTGVEGLVNECERHPNHKLQYLCKDCKRSVCDVCSDEEDVCSNHKPIPLTTVTEEYHQKIDASFATANSLIERKKVELEVLLKALSEDKDQSLLKIDSTFEQYVHTLNRRATLLKNKVIDIYNEHIMRLDSDLEEISTAMTCIVSLKEYHETMISRGDFTDIEKGIDELDEVSKNINDRVNPQINHISFEDKHGTDKFKGCVKDLGRVVCKPSVSKIVAIVEEAENDKKTLSAESHNNPAEGSDLNCGIAIESSDNETREKDLNLKMTISNSKSDEFSSSDDLHLSSVMTSSLYAGFGKSVELLSDLEKKHTSKEEPMMKTEKDKECRPLLIAKENSEMKRKQKLNDPSTIRAKVQINNNDKVKQSSVTDKEAGCHVNIQTSLPGNSTSKYTVEHQVSYAGKMAGVAGGKSRVDSEFWMSASGSVDSNLVDHDLINAELSAEQTSL